MNVYIRIVMISVRIVNFAMSIFFGKKLNNEQINSM